MCVYIERAFLYLHVFSQRLQGKESPSRCIDSMCFLMSFCLPSFPQTLQIWAFLIPSATRFWLASIMDFICASSCDTSSGKSLFIATALSAVLASILVGYFVALSTVRVLSFAVTYAGFAGVCVGNRPKPEHYSLISLVHMCGSLCFQVNVCFSLSGRIFFLLSAIKLLLGRRISSFYIVILCLLCWGIG